MAHNEAISPVEGAAVLEALFHQSPTGLMVLDRELRILRINVDTPFLHTAPPEQIMGRRVTDVYDFSTPGEVEAMLHGVLESGAPARGRLVAVRPKGAPGPEYLFSVSASRLEDAQRRILGVLTEILDVTEREKVRARLRVLGSVRERVGQTLDVVATCEELVRAVVPDLADIAVVDVVDAVVRGEEPPPSPLGREVPLRRAAFGRSGGEQQLQAHPVGDVRALPFPTPYARTLSDLKPRLVALGPETPWLAAVPQRAEAIRASGAHSLITTPLTLRGTVLGLMSLYRTDQGDPYDQGDVTLAVAVAAHTALCIDNARRYTREHTIALTIQRHLLLPHATTQTTVETAHLHVPSEVGGGSGFDTFALSGGRTALVVGEVAGQGIHAATTLGQIRTATHSLAALDLEPDELLARLNDTAISLAEERAALPPGDPMPLTGSCAYAVYDPLDQTCSIALAGHPPPVVAHPDGRTEIFHLPSGPPLGSTEGPPFAATTVSLTDGSVLAFYTPSLLHASQPPETLQWVLAHTDRPLQDLCDDVLYRLRNDTRHGDVILLLARTHAFPADQVAIWHLDHHPKAVATARTQTQDQLTRWGVDDETAYTTEIIVSELVTNAIRYGTPPVRLRLIKDRTLTCEVRDSNSLAPRLRHAKTIDEGGRGLFIIAQLAQNWGVRYSLDGKTIWAEQTLPPSTSPSPQ
ncbi:PAS domain S-box-containing protein [Streptomyces puniciscabiei]|uniref:PAS domain S-box-containing protein n=1 Tax=Streptomyces puniciscabiei TaxID=164348 RepID=A0A542U8Y4_9ACTN|nr:SpoIIE family protein phosphatase [Streptomyces puniciscabiei]TQK95543.1 PAS domain S-box-containing protein [Streptomyces puniciscabiei]